MKKASIIAATLLVVFGVTFGFVLSLNEDANAFQLCGWQCEFRTVWSHDTGEYCPCNGIGTTIYYVYRESSCLGGPRNCQYVKLWAGCWNGEVKIVQMCLL